jgi:hypothetical protein
MKTFLGLRSAEFCIRDDTSNFNTEYVILCCLLRAIAQPWGRWQMGVGQWWNDDYQGKHKALEENSASMPLRLPEIMKSKRLKHEVRRMQCSKGKKETERKRESVMHFRSDCFVFRISAPYRVYFVQLYRVSSHVERNSWGEGRGVAVKRDTLPPRCFRQHGVLLLARIRKLWISCP